MFFPIKRFSPAHLRSELKLLLALALPMMVAQLAQIGSGLVDTLMAGRAGADDLAAVGLGASIFATVMITLLGIPTALNPILAQLAGAKRFDQLRIEAQQGIMLSFAVGCLASLGLILLTFPLRSAFSLHPYTMRTMTLFICAIAMGVPAAVTYRALQAYAAALNRTRAMMWIGLGGLALNTLLNYLLIYGHWGFPRLGGAGCGFAGAAAFWFDLILFWLYLTYSPYFKPFALNRGWTVPQKHYWGEQLRLGIPVAFSFFLEVSLFSFVALMIANLGEHYIAAQQVVLVITSVLYIVPQTLGAAVGVRVGQSLGEGHPRRAYYVAGVGLGAGVVGALFMALFLVFLRLPLLSLFTDVDAIRKIAAGILLLAAVYQLFDAVQVIASGALRGYKITFVPMLIHGFAFWMIGLGIGYLLAFPCGMGLYGFWVAVIFSLAAAAFALTVYLVYVGRYRIREKHGSISGSRI